MKPHDFDSYKDKYETITLERSDDGILRVTFHDLNLPENTVRYMEADRPYGWTYPHVEWSHCFYDISRDYDNEVVIITGQADAFLDEVRHGTARDAALVGKYPAIDAEMADQIYHNGKQLQMNLLNIECPVIGALNGPAHVHAELALMSDIVIASPNTVIQDQVHFEAGLYSAGDGVGLWWPLVLGPSLGRYFLLTGQTLDAQRALELGIVHEIVESDQLLPRAYELARHILRRPKLVRRYTRATTTQLLKQQMLDHVGYGLALEVITAMARKQDAE